MYVVIVRFREIADSGHIYEVGNTFPRYGYEPTYERVQSLSTENNKAGFPVIMEIPDLDDEPEQPPPADPEQTPPADPEQTPPEEPEQTPPEEPEQTPPEEPKTPSRRVRQ